MMILMNKKIKIKFAELLDICREHGQNKKHFIILSKCAIINLGIMKLDEQVVVR